MNEIVLSLKEYSAATYYFIAGVLAIFLIMIYAVNRYLKKTEDKRRLRNVAYAMGVEFATDVMLPDGVDGYIGVECCMLTSRAIIILNVQNYPGILFGGKNTDLWTQMYRKKSFKFNNPLPYNEYCLLAVKSLVPNVPVVGRVVFTNAGSFPKGMPPGVSMLSELEHDLKEYCGKEDVPIRLQLAWQYLLDRVVQEKQKLPSTAAASRELSVNGTR